MKILLLNTQMEAAGAQKAMLILARGLQQRGHTVTVVTMYDKGNYVPLFEEQYGTKIVDLNMKPRGRVTPIHKGVRGLRGLLQLWKLIRDENFDIVQTFSHYSNILGPPVAYLAGTRVRLSSQRSSLKGAPAWLLQLDRWVANSPLIDKMVSVSEGTRQFSIDVEGIKPDKLVTIPNSIDIERFSPHQVDKAYLQQLRSTLGLSKGSPVVICVARLHPQKGHRFLIASIPAIREIFPDVHFLFVGEGELRQDLVNDVRRSGVEGAVSFLGMRQDIPELLALSDVFVLPSLWEGMPNSVLEAMAMGTPVIATAVDGCPEVIHHDVTGILLPPRDTEALVSAICRLLNNSEMRQSLAQAAQLWVRENFSEEKNVTAFEQLYARLVTAKTPGYETTSNHS